MLADCYFASEIVNWPTKRPPDLLPRRAIVENTLVFFPRGGPVSGLIFD